MDWVKLSTRYYLDPAMVSLPDADAEVMFTRGLAYAGAEETSGFIPSGIVPTLSRRRRYEASVDALVAASLWRPVAGGYQISRWEEWQEELEAIVRRRSADRERKRREREAKKKAQLKAMSRDMSADGHTDSPRTEKEKYPPLPPEGGVTAPPPQPPAGARRCTRHKRRRSGCRDCDGPPVIRQDARDVAAALAHPSQGCGHGTPPGQACALCRAGIPPEEEP